MDAETHNEFWTRTRASELANVAQISPQAVYKWRKQGIPPGRVPLVSKLTGFPMEKLHPAFR